MEGHLVLVAINVPKRGLRSNGKKKYADVRATFCHVSWPLQDKDPTSVPNFEDLRSNSRLCGDTRVVVDLWDITRKAESYDYKNHTFAATEPKAGQGPHPPTAVIFHQSRCGSTLLSNILASFMPDHTRVYSEAPAPMAALMACPSDGSATTNAKCDPGAHEKLIQDVFYMMGRSPGPTLPQYVFYKFQSYGSLMMNVFSKAMPETPWMFVYRDPVEILMSHFKNYQSGNPVGKRFSPNCLRNRGTSNQPPLLKTLVEKHGRKISDLSKEEYCAAHLASLGQSAFEEHEREKGLSDTAPRWFINYKDFPFRVFEDILPKLVTSVSSEQRQRMIEVSQKYSKGGKAGQTFLEDSTMKQGTAPQEIKDAASNFMMDVYHDLEDVRHEELQKKGGKY